MNSMIRLILSALSILLIDMFVEWNVLSSLQWDSQERAGFIFMTGAVWVCATVIKDMKDHW